MKVIVNHFLILCIIGSFLSCSSKTPDSSESNQVYKSTDLIIKQVAENSFVHVSFLQTDDFGNVPCNGLVVTNGSEAIIFDTPANDKGSEELIRWIKETLHCSIKAIIPTHFHNDCLGGLKTFHADSIPSYANIKTIELAKENNFPIPQNGFRDSLRLALGDSYVTVRFPGEGHTKDNVVGYFPNDNILFGGCLIKEVDASKGFLGDANVPAWAGTVERVKDAYPNIKIVVPGHGEPGGQELLDYTIKLFSQPK